MTPIEGIDIKSVVAEADKVFRKLAQGEVMKQVQRLQGQVHNGEVTIARMEMDLAKKKAEIEVIQKRLAAVREGDWTGLDNITIGGEEKQEKT